jgi:hypothetical protein
MGKAGLCQILRFAQDDILFAWPMNCERLFEDYLSTLAAAFTKGM